MSASVASGSLRRSCPRSAASGSMAFRGSTGRSSTGGCSYADSITLVVKLILFSFPVVGGVRQRGRPVGARRKAQGAAEYRREVARSPESHHSRNLRDGQILPPQAGAGAEDALADHELMGRQTRAALEEPREVIGAHVHDGRELGESQILVEVLLDV